MMSSEPEKAVTSMAGSAADFYKMAEHQGSHYTWVLDQAHKMLRPRRYFEIGTQSGSSLAASRCASVAVDPALKLRDDVVRDKPVCMLFQMTSDRFFSDYDLTALLGGPIEMAFLDGLHLYEFLIRDFANTEKHCKQNSVVFIHDCIPTDSYIARRSLGDTSLGAHSTHRDWWAGDVWKAIAIIEKARPDLKVYAFDAPPTGLIAITNLDASSSTLTDNYFDLVKEYQQTSLTDNKFERYVDDLRVTSTEAFRSPERVSEMFWL